MFLSQSSNQIWKKQRIHYTTGGRGSDSKNRGKGIGSEKTTMKEPPLWERGTDWRNHHTAVTETRPWGDGDTVQRWTTVRGTTIALQIGGEPPWEKGGDRRGGDRTVTAGVAPSLQERSERNQWAIVTAAAAQSHTPEGRRWRRHRRRGREVQGRRKGGEETLYGRQRRNECVTWGRSTDWLGLVGIYLTKGPPPSGSVPTIQNFTEPIPNPVLIGLVPIGPKPNAIPNQTISQVVGRVGLTRFTGFPVSMSTPTCHLYSALPHFTWPTRTGFTKKVTTEHINLFRFELEKDKIKTREHVNKNHI